MATQNAIAPQSPQYLFVYGTLRPKTRHEMAKWLARQADVVGNAQFQGKMYRIEDYPGVTPSRDASAQVRGEVFALRQKNAQKVLQRLDEYEEYNAADEKNSEFVRRVRKIQIDPNRPAVDCWIYLYNRRPKKNQTRILTGEWG